MSSKIKYHIFNSSPRLQKIKNTGRGFRWRLFQNRSLEDKIEYLVSKGFIAKASLQAIKEQHARGLSVTIKEGNAIYKFYPDGKMRKIMSDFSQPQTINENYLLIPD